MSLLKRLLGKREPPRQRIQVCMECGMPVGEHKEWCAILRGQNDQRRRIDTPEAPTTASQDGDHS
jgi:hypothetical protein